MAYLRTYDRTASLLAPMRNTHNLRAAVPSGELGWDFFFESWFRIVRRVILGDGARDDHKLTDAIKRLRQRGNWAFTVPKSRRLLDEFHERLRQHLDRAEEGSLAELVARQPATNETHPTHQIAQWFFAFDPGGMATFRTLALLVTHPDALDRRAIAASSSFARVMARLRAGDCELEVVEETVRCGFPALAQSAFRRDGKIQKHLRREHHFKFGFGCRVIKLGLLRENDYVEW